MKESSAARRGALFFLQWLKYDIAYEAPGMP